MLKWNLQSKPPKNGALNPQWIYPILESIGWREWCQSIKKRPQIWFRNCLTTPCCLVTNNSHLILWQLKLSLRNLFLKWWLDYTGCGCGFVIAPLQEYWPFTKWMWWSCRHTEVRAILLSNSVCNDFYVATEDQGCIKAGSWAIKRGMVVFGIPPGASWGFTAV